MSILAIHCKDDKRQFQRLDIGLNNKAIISVLWENKF